MRTHHHLALAAALLVAAPGFGQDPPGTGQNAPNPNNSQNQTQNQNQVQNPVGDSPALHRTSPPSAAELPKLGGAWTIAAAERNGQRLPDEQVAGLRVTITADTITVFTRDNKPHFVVKYKLDTARTPNEINMEMADGPNRGQLAQGIVTMDSAEQVRLIYSTGSQGRPRDFITRPGGTTATLFVLKRAATAVVYAGTWQAVDAEAGGKKLPPEQINRTKVVMTNNTLVLTDDYSHLTFVANYRVDTARTPNTITLTVLEGANKGQAGQGVIAEQGTDRVRLCFTMGQAQPAANGQPGQAPSFCYTLARLPSPVGAPPGAAQIPPQNAPLVPGGGQPAQGGAPSQGQSNTQGGGRPGGQ
jgi:uncharacterized protein (TIGR03067 family)